MVVNGLTALDRIYQVMADGGVGIFLGWPKTYDPDRTPGIQQNGFSPTIGTYKMSKTAHWENLMTSIATNLARLLNGVQRPDDFYTFGTCEIFAPGVEVRGDGPIGLPLLPAQAEQLGAVAEPAP